MKLFLVLLATFCFVTCQAQKGVGNYDDDRKPDEYDAVESEKTPDSPGLNPDPGDSKDSDKSENESNDEPSENKDCFCVPYYQCQEGKIVDDGTGIIQARNKPPPEQELPLESKFEPPFCGPYHVCCSEPQENVVTPYEQKCGIRNPGGIFGRILSPDKEGEAKFGEWPWQAAILKTEDKVNLFQCGGVLLDKRHVVTVAHCVCPYKDNTQYPLKVRLGEYDTQRKDELRAHADYLVENIICHPQFRSNSLWNDIAILKLDGDVKFEPHIDTICLPNYDEVFEGQSCVVTGWGKDAYKGGTYSNILKEVNVPVIDNTKCQSLLRKTRLGKYFRLHESFICAGGEEGLDSCKGDGGGPITCYRKDGTYALAGLVAWGIDCGHPNVPGVYVRVQKFLDWITQQTGGQIKDYWPKVD